MLSVRDLSTAVLRPASFDLADGECVAVRGASGAGKSVLLRAVADLDPNRGDVRLDGAGRESMPAPEWRRKVTYVAAEPGWWADRVADHFRDSRAAVPAMADLGLPEEALDWPVTRLSTGEKQRLSLVRALVLAPRVLLLDEPTGPLDPGATERVEAVLRRMMERGTSVLIVTHDEAQAGRIASRVLRVEKGGVSEEGAP